MNSLTLLSLLENWDAIEQTDTYGGVAQPERLQQVARAACDEWAGDLVEIGCQYGLASVQLAQVARAYNRKLITIDPYQIGTQNCDGGELEIFLEATAPYSDVVEFYRLDSRDGTVAKLLRSRPLAFAFVDGLHTYAACQNDIANTKHAGLITVDDVLWSEEVQRAFCEAEQSLHRTAVRIVSLREGYLV